MARIRHTDIQHRHAEVSCAWRAAPLGSSMKVRSSEAQLAVIFGRWVESKFGERSILRERLSLFGVKRHPRDLGYHLCTERLDFERPNGTHTKCCFFFFFIVVLAVGNHHVFKGPDDLNGYGYFYVRFYWKEGGYQAKIAEEYLLSSAVLRIFDGLKRTWDQKRFQGLMSGQLNLAITGSMSLTFMTINLFQFRDLEQYFLRLPPTLTNWLITFDVPLD